MIEKEVRLGFVGDIMCEKPLLKSANKKGKYDFTQLFSGLSKEFNEVDYMVGNLETVFAGEEAGYTNQIYSFNTPDSFLISLSKSGLDMVSTANNHCLDRGIPGLVRTNELLDSLGIDRTGTYNSQDEKRVLIKEIKGIKIAFLSYTYGTNTQVNKRILSKDDLFRVNLLQPQVEKIYAEDKKGLKHKVAKMIFKILTVDQWIALKRKLKMTYNEPRRDDILDNISQEYLDKIQRDIELAKAKADFVIMCLHSGGQFNEEPGAFSQFMMEFMAEKGVDVVVGHHPHVIQKHVRLAGMPGFYSLGNFSMSPSSVYNIPESMSDYGIFLYLNLRMTDKPEISGMDFSIIKMQEDKGSLSVRNISDIYSSLKNKEEKEKLKNESLIIYNRFQSSGLEDLIIREKYKVNLDI